ncbi:MAG: molybdopterin-synthase adenylyltransferase MoeB [Gammaproteobacteria bacterium]|nr:molybdenum cofactor biosynthesis protein MoeB [Gammaproteobacteria bacterium]
MDSGAPQSAPFSAAEQSRYSRHLTLPEIGVAGQKKLRAARVLLVGAGGLGSPSSLYLAAAGVGTLGLVDNDRVELSNLQRQVLYGTDLIGQPKVHAARARLEALNPDVRVEVYDIELTAANVLDILSSYDLILDGSDRFRTRYLVNDACVLLGKPLISAAIHRFEGQATTYVPGAGPCYRCLFPAPPADGLVPNCAEAGVLGVLPGVMGAIQATEAIKLIVGAGELLIGRLLTYNALSLKFGEFRFGRRADCPVCGDHPTIREVRDLPEACGADDLAAVRRLDPRTLYALLSGPHKPPVIVDVREPREFAVAHLPASVNIPVRELEGRLAELSQHETVVFVCRSGARSLTASGMAHRAGMRKPAHLEGGLLAWARDVDPSFEVAPVG